MNLRFPAIVLTTALLGACAAPGKDFSWYHPQGGEYLFAYDRNACETVVADRGLSLGTDISGPFFQCMHARGYYLVDANGIIQAPPAEATLAERQISQQ